MSKKIKDKYTKVMSDINANLVKIDSNIVDITDELVVRGIYDVNDTSIEYQASLEVQKQLSNAFKYIDKLNKSIKKLNKKVSKYDKLVQTKTTESAYNTVDKVEFTDIVSPEITSFVGELPVTTRVCTKNYSVVLKILHTNAFVIKKGSVLQRGCKSFKYDKSKGKTCARNQRAVLYDSGSLKLKYYTEAGCNKVLVTQDINVVGRKNLARVVLGHDNVDLDSLDIKIGTKTLDEYLMLGDGSLK